jgi:hypothetical protein
MANFTFILYYSRKPHGNLSSPPPPPRLIKHVTQIKQQKYKSNNIFIYVYWLYSQCMIVTTAAPQFTRCLFTALRTIISELQKSGCNSCSGVLSLHSPSVTTPEKLSTPFIVSLCMKNRQQLLMYLT